MEKAPEWNLNEKRPKVLLLGNGLIRASGKGKSWIEVILNTSRQDANIREFLKKPQDPREGFAFPYNPLIMATSVVEDKQRRLKYVNELSENDKSEMSFKNPLLEELLKCRFDAILTTNYTYEIENEERLGFNLFSEKAKRNCSRSFHKNGKDKPKDIYMLQRFNKVSEDCPGIWHVHGELTRPSSLVMSHDEYVRQTYDILKYCRNQKNRYEKEFANLSFQSWVDYFLMGDVFVLGFGFDVTEIDLWWLLGRRVRERSKTGTIIFYEGLSEETRYKQIALKNLKVNVENCGFVEKDEAGEEDTSYYAAFYEAAVSDIKTRLIL